MFGSMKSPKGDAKIFCDAIGSNIHQQISKALKETNTVFNGANDLIFFKSYFDAFYLGVILKTDGPTEWINDEELKKWICNGVIPKRLWDFYTRAEGLIELSKGMENEKEVAALVSQAQAAGTQDAIDITTSLYMFLTGKDLTLKKNELSEELDDHKEAAINLNKKPKAEPKAARVRSKAKSETNYTGNTRQQQTQAPKSNTSTTNNKNSSGSKTSIFVVAGIVIFIGGAIFFAEIQKTQNKKNNSTVQTAKKSNTQTVKSIVNTKKHQEELNLQKQLESRFNSGITNTLQTAMWRYGNSLMGSKSVLVELYFTSSGMISNYQIVNGDRSDKEMFKRVMQRVSLPPSPDHMSATKIRLQIPKRQTQVQNSAPTTSTSSKPKPVQTLQLDDNPMVVVNNNGILDLTITTNWTPKYQTPSVFIASQESFSARGIEFDQKLVSGLNIDFRKSTRKIHIRSKSFVPSGDHTILLEIINGNKVINVPVWFKVPRNQQGR